MSRRVDFHGALSALMGLLETRVGVAVGGLDPEDRGHVLDVVGTLIAGWDQDIAIENGVGDSALFKIREYDGFALYLTPEDFRDADVRDDGTVVILAGGLGLEIGPPQWEPADTDSAD